MLELFRTALRGSLKIIYQLFVASQATGRWIRRQEKVDILCVFSHILPLWSMLILSHTHVSVHMLETHPVGKWQEVRDRKGCDKL